MQLSGLHLEKNILTLALVAKEKKRFKVKQLATVSLENKKELLKYLSFKEEKDLFFVSSVDTQEVLLRSLDMPLRSRRGLLKTLPFQLEQLIPYPLEEVMISTHIDKPSFSIRQKALSVVTLFCFHEKFYREHLEKYLSQGIDPDWIGFIPHSLYRFCKYYIEKENFIALHMAEDATHLIAVSEDKLRHAFQINIGKEAFLKALQEDNPSLSSLEVEKLFYQTTSLSTPEFKSFSSLIEKFLKELDRIFYFLVQKEEGKIDQIFFAKEEVFLKLFKDRLEHSLERTLQVIDSSDPEIPQFKPYAISIGGAIDVLSKDNKTLQLRKVEDLHSKMRRTLLKKISVYGILCLICYGLLTGFSHVMFERKKHMLNEKLSLLVKRYPQEGIELQNEEKEFFSRLEKIEKYMNKIKKPYGYYLTPITVSEFLSYLYQQLLGFSLVSLEEMHYELVQYPSLQQPLEPYKIKISLKIKAKERKHAELFFDTLFRETAYVEETLKPELTQESDEYKTSFFLKSAK
jgi:Tfp pilus assembly PilM family ATPase